MIAVLPAAWLLVKTRFLSATNPLAGRFYSELYDVTRKLLPLFGKAVVSHSEIQIKRHVGCGGHNSRQHTAFLCPARSVLAESGASFEPKFFIRRASAAVSWRLRW